MRVTRCVPVRCREPASGATLGLRAMWSMAVSIMDTSSLLGYVVGLIFNGDFACIGTRDGGRVATGIKHGGHGEIAFDELIITLRATVLQQFGQVDASPTSKS